MSEFFYFDNFQKHKEEALRYYNQGEISDARYHFLKAAEYLLKLAQISKGRLKQVRANQASKLLDMVKNLEKRKHSPRPRTLKASETPVSTEDTEARPDEWIVKEKPDVKFSDIAGLEDVKEQIRIKMIYPFTHPEKASHYGVKKGGGILLYGPPGTGKTMLGKAVATELDAPFFVIKPSDILSKWVGESEKNIEKLFDEARKYEKAVIFIDEVESLVPKRRDSQSTVMQRVVPQILAELDGFEKRENTLLFVGATNEPWEIDYAMLRPGRLDEKIYIGLPDEAAREQILQSNLKDAPLEQNVNFDKLADSLEKYSGADIAYLCRKARENVFQESVEKGIDRSIKMDDFEKIISKMSPSVSEEDVKRFESFKKEIA